MDKQDHLLVRGMEECAEIAQRISKALVFGLEEVQPGQLDTNTDRVRGEVVDLLAVLHMAGIVKVHPATIGGTSQAGYVLVNVSIDEIEAKRRKVEKYIEYSKSVGR